MKTLNASDIPAGSEAVAYIEQNGKIEEFFYAKKIEAKGEISKTEIKVMGKRGTQNKPSGWKGTGSLTVYYVTSTFRQMLAQYAKTGVLPSFKLVITNEDKGTTIGKQTTVLYDCTVNSVKMCIRDRDYSEQEVTFKFNKTNIVNESELVDMINSSRSLLPDKLLLPIHPFVEDVSEALKLIEEQKKEQEEQFEQNMQKYGNTPVKQTNEEDE